MPFAVPHGLRQAGSRFVRRKGVHRCHVKIRIRSRTISSRTRIRTGSRIRSRTRIHSRIRTRTASRTSSRISSSRTSAIRTGIRHRIGTGRTTSSRILGRTTKQTANHLSIRHQKTGTPSWEYRFSVLMGGFLFGRF